MKNTLVNTFFIALSIFLLATASFEVSQCDDVCSDKQASKLEYATLAGGCFWCTEAIFERIPGVIDVESGYAGGVILNPTYQQVKSGQSGYAEVIRIIYNPVNITYENLINAFFFAHDPTTLNRQGIDVGHQYRSAIYYHNEEQKRIAEKVIKQLESEKVFENPIVTEVTPIKNYYPAEDYHQDYFDTFQENKYCTVDTADIAIKIEKFFSKFDKIINYTLNAQANTTERSKLSAANIKVVLSANPFHPWHNISFGDKAPEMVQAVIEVQQGSRAKYEIDKVSGYLALDRVTHPAFPYPVHYGFIPQTLYGDGDALDILIFSSVSLQPLSLVSVRVIGVMNMIDGNQMDDKIITIVDKDPTFSHIHNIKDLPAGTLEEITTFFENYKKSENGDVVIKGVDGKEKAYKAIKEGIELYRDVYAFSS